MCQFLIFFVNDQPRNPHSRNAKKLNPIKKKTEKMLVNIFKNKTSLQNLTYQYPENPKKSKLNPTKKKQKNVSKHFFLKKNNINLHYETYPYPAIQRQALQ